MEITSEYVTALRTLITGEDHDSELDARLLARDGVMGRDHIFSALSAMAFQLAARRRFPGGWTDADVIRLVGHTRAKFEGFEINPLVAEATLRSTLGDTAVTEPMDGLEIGAAILPLLIVLLEQLGITTDRVDDFLADVLPHAQAWLASEESVSAFNKRVAESRSAG